MFHHLHDVSSLILHLTHKIIDSRLTQYASSERSYDWASQLLEACVLISCIALLRDTIVGLTEGLKPVRRLSQDPSKLSQAEIMAEQFLSRKQNACSQPVPSHWFTHTDRKTTLQID
jgi:hypothetical protein